MNTTRGLPGRYRSMGGRLAPALLHSALRFLLRRPRPLRIRIGHETRSGIAFVTGPGTPEFQAALKPYRDRFPRVHYRPGDQLVAVTLHTYHY